MGIREIVLNSIRERKGKVFFMMLGILIGVSTVVALFSLTSAMGQKVYAEIEEVGNKVLIMPRTESASFTFGGIDLASDITFGQKQLAFETLETLKNQRDSLGIREISPKKVEGINLNENQLIMVGIDFFSEFHVKPWLRYEGQLPETDREIILGANVAEALNLSIGDKVNLEAKELMVSGIMEETGAEEDNVVLSRIDLANQLSGNQSLSLIELTMDKTLEFEANIEKIRILLPEARVTPVKEVMESRLEVIERFQFFALLVAGVMLIVISLIVLTTAIGSVEERVKEIGIFRAIGFRKRHIKRIILWETAIICLAGGLSGVIVGFIVAKVIAPFIEEGSLIISLNPLLATIIIGITLLVGIAASWLPAVKASNLDPTEAVRYI